MATTVSASNASAAPSQTAVGDTHENNVLSAGLARCRKWLRHQKNTSTLRYPSTPTTLRATSAADRSALQSSTADFAPSICTNSDSSIAAASSASHSNSAVTSATAAVVTASPALAASAACPPPGTSGSLVHLMNGRWSGCLAPTLSSRSLTSGPRQPTVLRSRTSALLGSAAAAAEGPSRTTSIMIQSHSYACVPSQQQQQQQRTGTSHSNTSIQATHNNAHEDPGRRSRAIGPDIGLSVPTEIVGIEVLSPDAYHVHRPSHSRIPGAALPLSPISASPPLSRSSAVLNPEPPVYCATASWDDDDEEEGDGCVSYTGQAIAAEPSPVTPRASHDRNDSNVNNTNNDDNNGRYGPGRASSLLFCECSSGGPPHTHRVHQHRRSYASSMTGSFSGNISLAGDNDDVTNSPTDLGVYATQLPHSSGHSLARINEEAANFGIRSFGSATINGIHDSEYASVGLTGSEEQHLYASETASAETTHQQLPVHVAQTQNYHNHPGYATASASASASASATTTGASSAAAIVSIFSIGQPAHPHKRLTKRLARVRRMSRRLASSLARALHLRRRRQAADTNAYASQRVVSDSDRVCSDALLAAFSAESSLMSSTQLLERMRSMQTMSFRVRADRVHLAQSQLLHCVYILFTQQVRAEQRQSRHYRFYLPEDDQAELDRGFSESVLFAAQALSRGFQIRGTEVYTQALREPAWMLCSVWAALRHVLHVRGQDLWRTWTHGTGLVSGRDGRSLVHYDELVALREVLEDFDEAWVRFERDLCFAYFGLSNAQIAGIMDPNSSGDALAPESQRIAQEEEFSLLVVLMSETLQRCLGQDLATRDQIECMDPVLVISLPRLAILHAIARNGAEGLRFVDSDSAPMFWWFRDYKDLCKRVSDAAETMSPALYEVLQRMLIAEEADIVLSQCSDDVFAGSFIDSDKTRSYSGDTQRTATAGNDPATSTSASSNKNCCCLGARRKTLDLESIIDSPRTTRSLSIDDCISSMYASSSPQCLSPESGKPVTTTAEAVAAAAAAAAAARSRASSTGCLVCALPDSERLAARNNSECDRPLCRGRAASSASVRVASPLDSMGAISLASTMSTPILGGGCYNCMMATPTSLMPPQASTLARIDTMAKRKANIESQKTGLRKVFVDVCTVADSLHSGPFARPFRMALELVFRMNIADADEAEVS
ncbi:hypothetical protein EV178_001386 [Coemansia sp. RSA 1646]|nr:hypothetical protein EV178_001386 [Coemansia sp. RSA 1646]